MDAIAGRFLSLGEAGAAKNALEAAGIECWLGDDAIVGLDWMMAQAVGHIKLRVRAEDLEIAQAILAGNVEYEDIGPPPFPAESSTTAARNGGAPQCPECGSPDVAPIRRFRMFLLIALLFIGIGAAVGQTALALTPVPALGLALMVAPSRRCGACEHRWTPDDDGEEVEAPPPDPSDTAEVICTRCGSAEVYDIDYRRLKALPLLFTPAMLFVAPYWLALPKRMCSNCGQRY
ncbi:MAG TPA: hypothetical protein VMS98_03040 [Thermoanaerobaculia bacterium]|nr:hypothetical protein [Thermoanaerobaculia bacterium]